MKEIAQFILSTGLIYFFIEMFAATVLFSHPLKWRGHFGRRLLLCLAELIGLGTVSCLGLYHMSNYIDALYMQIVWCNSVLFICVMLVWTLHEVSLREALYCAACAYLMEHLAYCIRILLALALPTEIMDTGAWGYYLIHIAVYGAVYHLFARRMIQNGSLSTTARESLVLTWSTLMIVAGMSAAASAYDFEIAHAVYASFCCIAVLFGQVKQQKQIKYQSELALQQQMWSLHKTQYEMSKESIDIINRKCHDLKHQVAALKHIRDPERRSEVIDSLQSSVMIYDAVMETGNEILDTVLTEKSLICGKHDITLSCIVDGKQLSFIAPVDLYTLVGNALDNAVEAVLSMPPAERLIRFRVQEKAGLVFLHIENPYSGALELRDGLPVIRKTDTKNHGFGLKSIRDIGEKYHGMLTLKPENGQFILTLAFPLFEQQFTAEN